MIEIAVVGLGLIGGSVALAARQRMGVRVLGVDRAQVVDSELARSVATELVEVDDWEAACRALARADLVVLATPVHVIAEQVVDLLEVANVVTDCGSTKRRIVNRAALSPRADRFVPGHPMAGGPEPGLSHARAGLFVDRPWVLCTEGRAPDAVELVEQLVQGVGAYPVTMNAEQHDWWVAIASHLPRLVASAITILGAGSGAEAIAGPAYQAMRSVAGGDLRVWRDILESNADEVARALRELQRELSSVASGLENIPVELGPACALLAQAQRSRRQQD